MAISKEIQKLIQDNLLTELSKTGPILNTKFKTHLKSFLNLSDDVYGTTKSGVSCLDTYIGSLFYNYKQEGKVKQTGWTWEISNEVKVTDTEEPVQEPILEDIQEEEEEEAVMNILTVEEIPVEETVTQELEIPKLLSCPGFRNSLIEATLCFGTYSKSECHSCLLKSYCIDFTKVKQEQKLLAKQAKKEAANNQATGGDDEKSKFFKQYGDKGIKLYNELKSNNATSIIKISCSAAQKCKLDDLYMIQTSEECYFIANFGIISTPVYNSLIAIIKM